MTAFFVLFDKFSEENLRKFFLSSLYIPTESCYNICVQQNLSI